MVSKAALQWSLQIRGVEKSENEITGRKILINTNLNVEMSFPGHSNGKFLLKI